VFDVVVIGAGPAGTMTAFHAARGGLRVLLVDRAPIGRPKACGDALSPNGVAAVRGMGVGDPDWHVVEGLHIHTDHRGCGTELFSGHTAPHFGATIERRHFDAWMVQQATRAGAEFATGEVLELGFASSGRVSSVALRGAEGTTHIAAEHVVLATGAAVPRFAKNLFSRVTPMRFAAAGRGYVDIEGDTGRFLHAVLPIDAGGAALLGYAWAFPVSASRLNVGVGVLRDAAHRTIALSSLVDAAVEKLSRHANLTIEASAVSEFQSAPLMLGPATGGPAGVLAVGDIAGLTHPISGEGIATALESGELAARAMLGHCESDAIGSARGDTDADSRGQSGDDTSTDYWPALADKKRRLYRGTERIQSIVARPAFAVQRGADIVTRNDRFAGRAMRRFMWEFPTPASSAGFAPSERDASGAFVDSVADLLVDAVAETAPGVAVLMQELFDSQESEFGYLARFYASACSDLGVDCNSDDVMIAALAEATTLTAYLGADLAGHSDDPHLHGSNALALLAIDAITAFVMDRAAVADERVARLVLARSRELLEIEAAATARDTSAANIATTDLTSVSLPEPDWALAARLVALRVGEAHQAELLEVAAEFETPALALAVGADEGSTLPDQQPSVSAWLGERLQSLCSDYRHRRVCGS
jgi:geranylgeranyl reductase family protein